MTYTLELTREEINELAGVFDALTKAYGLQVLPAAGKWVDRLNGLLTPTVVKVAEPKRKKAEAVQAAG